MATQLGTHTNNASGEIYTAMAFNPSLPVLAVGTANGVAKLFDMRNLGKPLTQEQVRLSNKKPAFRFLT
jgi:hypothetical protein